MRVQTACDVAVVYGLCAKDVCASGLRRIATARGANVDRVLRRCVTAFVAAVLSRSVPVVTPTLGAPPSLAVQHRKHAARRACAREACWRWVQQRVHLRGASTEQQLRCTMPGGRAQRRRAKAAAACSSAENIWYCTGPAVE